MLGRLRKQRRCNLLQSVELVSCAVLGTFGAALTGMVDTSVRAVAVVKQDEALFLHMWRGFVYVYIQFMSPEYKPAASNYAFQGSLSI